MTETVTDVKLKQTEVLAGSVEGAVLLADCK